MFRSANSLNSGARPVTEEKFGWDDGPGLDSSLASSVLVPTECKVVPRGAGATSTKTGVAIWELPGKKEDAAESTVNGVGVSGGKKWATNGVVDDGAPVDGVVILEVAVNAAVIDRAGVIGAAVDGAVFDRAIVFGMYVAIDGAVDGIRVDDVEAFVEAEFLMVDNRGDIGE
ncbi:hypothetical protein NDU88_007597 [Pleurodeles waltl]|uniref:Uncharacterized protein n=1 Tax=Pleurodeles waltl TaxID=8319 RepID=A0AAV7N4J1_PLEWA|nr:hypothetical protein NDU88_007597 [Pleurodeles waltl]